jgi:CHAT domain-containing protein
MEACPAQAMTSSISRSSPDRGNCHSHSSGLDEYLRRILAIDERLAPVSRDVARDLDSLGQLVFSCGDWAGAEEYYRRALEVWQRVDPGSINVSVSFVQLAAVAHVRGDRTRADAYHERARAIHPAQVPGSIDDLLQSGDGGREWPSAEEVEGKLGPGFFYLAGTLVTLGDIANAHGQSARAEEYYQRALEIEQKLGLSDTATRALVGLGKVVEKRGEVDHAEECYRRALAIEEKVAPGGISVPSILKRLADFLIKQGRTDEGVKYLAQRVDWVEESTAHLGGTESIRSGFRASRADYFLDLEDALVAQKQPQQAYEVSERFRARSLLQMLAERDLVFSTDVPADLQLTRKRNAAEYNGVQGEIAKIGATRDQKKIDELSRRLRELSAEREQIAERIKKTSPHFASLQYAQPLDLAATRQALDPGTALLSYSVGEEHTVLFVAQPAGSERGFSVFTLPVKEKELVAKVREFRRLIEQHKQGTDHGLVAPSQQLYDLLLKPAESLIAASSRLLIVPDGPLQLLPFAALRRSATEYLVDWKPVHTVVSATVYAELKKMRHSVDNKAVELAAFGDPHMPALGKDGIERSRNTELRFASERGFTFARLPFSRQEVEGIEALYPKRNLIYLGSEATEEHAKALGTNVRYIHFATHGLLDERFPLNSALVLTIPKKVEEGKENGLLQAWEIFEQMRLDADLVTLSACNTGLGQELSGEGLIGLTRAFQYAGAHSVLASLWNVDDFRTMQLMERFYTELKHGKSKDEALRAAQLELLHSPGGSPPYYWAGFSLIGDWR